MKLSFILFLFVCYPQYESQFRLRNPQNKSTSSALCMLSDLTLVVASLGLGWCRLKAESSVRDAWIIRLQFLSSVLSLTSNCWTLFFRESQIVYATVLVVCDAQLMVWKPNMLVICLLVALYLFFLISVCGSPFFQALGLISGYTAGLMNLFLFGVALAFPGREPLREPSLGFVCAAVYMLMLFYEPGDDLYATHMELIRWYGSTGAVMLLNVIGIGRGGTF